jgi:two-component system, sensor histidine kinase and response regulator
LRGMSGFDTCQAVRASPVGRGMAILFVTAVNNPDTYQKALDAGADDFLSKPVHRAELLLRVRALLSLKRMGRELAESNQLLRGQRDALVRAQRQKEDLTEIIVHDLKNPLAAIVANASFLASAKDLTQDSKESAEGVLRASEAMLRMVYNLLDISRSEDGALKLQRGEVDLAACLRDTCDLMARRAQDRKQSLEISCPDAPLKLWADADLLRRLVENLLDNALRYTPSRGRVRVSAHVIERDVEIRISDEGPGIPTEDKARVFEKYARLQRAEDHAQQRLGRGLGLTFCKLVTDVHAGSIRVEDNVPRGACFCVRLPTGKTD